MFKNLVNRIKESSQSVLPITIVILILIFVLDVGKGDLWEFAISSVMLIVGLVLFNIGANSSMIVIAERIGSFITRKRNLTLLIFITFLIGFMITIAEPSLWVLADQFIAVNTMIMILSVAIGVAVFLVIAILRIVFQVKLSIILLMFYSLIFIIAFFIPKEFVPISFDSGGATTGAMAVPFIIALGIGVSYARGEGKADEDVFGLIGIASIGPIISVLIIGLFFSSSFDSQIIDLTLSGYLFKYGIEVLFAIMPFVIFFVIFQVFAFKFSKRNVIKIIIGFISTYLGMVLFLSGASAGYISIGALIGERIASIPQTWLLIPIGMILGFVVVIAEPSVIILNKQIEDVTGGAIPRKLMMIFMSIGMAIAVGLACLRVVTGISIWWIIFPGYLLALFLTFFTPKKFTAIAFDSGGAVSGVMTSIFLVSFAIGAAGKIEGSNILTDAFGMIGFVAMTPLIVIQFLGIFYQLKTKNISKQDDDEEIIDLI